MRYIGTKILKNAQLMKKKEYCKYRGWSVPSDEDPDEVGYLVVYEDGYESWSPKDVFDSAYKPFDNLNFGLAIEAAKYGCKIARKGWNGKNMFVVYQKGYPEGIPCNKNTAEAFGMEEGELFIVRPYLQMRCADGTHQMWLASQSDVLADDWYVV